jgi:hypothetical protein
VFVESLAKVFVVRQISVANEPCSLKWNAYTKYLTIKGFTRMWILRRLKNNGASESELKDIYIKQIRSVLEYAAVVWHPGLTQVNTAEIERIQKTACAIILGSNYLNYENGLETLKLERLNKRRENLSKKFAGKAFKSEKFTSWIVKDSNENNTRRKAQKVKNVQARTRRLRKSPLPYLTSLLNQDIK